MFHGHTSEGPAMSCDVPPHLGQRPGPLEGHGRRPAGAPGTGPGVPGMAPPAARAEVRIHQLPGIHGLHAAPRGGRLKHR